MYGDEWSLPNRHIRHTGRLKTLKKCRASMRIGPGRRRGQQGAALGRRLPDPPSEEHTRRAVPAERQPGTGPAAGRMGPVSVPAGRRHAARREGATAGPGRRPGVAPAVRPAVQVDRREQGTPRAGVLRADVWARQRLQEAVLTSAGSEKLTLTCYHHFVCFRPCSAIGSRPRALS